jgi:type II secretory pathway component GspD/PulD (secretin)
MRLFFLGGIFLALSSCSPRLKKTSCLPHFEASLFEKISLKKSVNSLKLKDKADLFQTPLTCSFSEEVTMADAFKTLTSKRPFNFSLNAQSKEKKGGIYQARQKPLIEIIEDLCNLTHSRYYLKQGTLMIEEDLPYLEVHSVSFLSGARKTQNQLNITTNLLSSPEGKGGDNSSNTRLSGEATADFWGELQQNLELILNPPEIQVPLIQEAFSSKKPPLLDLLLPEEDPHELPQRSLQLLGSPEGSISQKASCKSDTPGVPLLQKNFLSQRTAPYAFHKQAGLLSVYGTQKQQKLVENYLKRLQQLVHTQVTIEAKIFEVLLNDTFKTGIDWHSLGRHLGIDFRGALLEDPGNFTWKIQTPQFSSCLSWMERFGTVRTLSNPRITVLNNQPAVIKVAKNEVFFRLEIDRVISSDNKPDLETTVSQMQTVPIGLMMMVQPSINLETEEITLTLRPSLSRVVEMRDDPAVAIRSDNKIRSQIPIVQTREIDSVIQLKSGETVVLGGLIEENRTEEQSGLPGNSINPFLDHFLSQKTKSTALTELVIFLKASLKVPET